MQARKSWIALLASFALGVCAVNSVGAEKDIVDTAVSAGSFNTLAAALQAAGLVDALKADGPLTVFAPTDEAFAKLPAGTVQTLLKPENKQKLIDILTYHVVDGRLSTDTVVRLSGAKTLNGQQIDIVAANGEVRIDQAKVIQTDIDCTNGVIHVIDQVMLPAEDDLPTTAVKAKDFSKLVAAVQASGLLEALSGDGPFTVFAPTDEAFGRLPAGTVETLLKPENKSKLAAILQYHVVPGRVYSSDALAAGNATTLQGNDLSISLDNGTARVNDAKLVATDIDASNGVIHVIDQVLIPSNDKQAAVHPRRMIEVAINRGAPLYNAGHHAECAKLYMTTVRDLLATEGEMCGSTMNTLQTALRNAEHSSSADSQAWTLRHALDFAYQNMR